MALLLKKLYTAIIYLNELQDPRTKGDLFVASPLNLMVVLGMYVYIFKNLGPQLMENRKPFNIRKAMIVYNALQILFNSYIAAKSTMNMWNMENPFCKKIDYSFSPQSLEIIRIGRLFMYLKIFDLLDTLFFLLRKSYRQISFLHMYHHWAVILLIWTGYRFYGGDGSMHWMVNINSIVHVIMFTYYLLTSIDEKWKSNVTFKKTLTQIQLIQFLFFVIVYGRITMIPACNITLPILSFTFVVQNIFMFFLFGDFYIKTYIKPNKLKQ